MRIDRSIFSIISCHMISLQYFVQILEIDPIYAKHQTTQTLEDGTVETIPGTIFHQRPYLNPLRITQLMNPLDIYFPDYGFYYGQISFDPSKISVQDIVMDELIDPTNILIRNDIKSPELVPICQQIMYHRFQQMKTQLMIGPSMKCIVQPFHTHGLVIKGLMLTEFILTSNQQAKSVMFADGSILPMTFQGLTERGPFDFTPLFHQTRPNNLNLQLKVGVTGSQLGFYADYHMRPRLMTKDECLQIGGVLRHLHLLVDAPAPYYMIRKQEAADIYYVYPELNIQEARLSTVYGFSEYIDGISLFLIYNIESKEMVEAYQCITHDHDWRWEPMTPDAVDELYRQHRYL